MKDVILSARGLHKSYRIGRKEVRAVGGMDIDIEKGVPYAIIGPSGAGKSTLMHMLGGLDRPTSGKVEIDGMNIYKLSDKERAGVRNEKIGFVFQFYHLLPEFSALENVMMPGVIKGRRKKEEGRGMRDEAKEALKLVGLSDRLDHRPAELSGGESQRVAIARALVNRPKILLCDEPTGNLDSKTSQSIYDLLFKLQSETGMSLVIVTHDQAISHHIRNIIHMVDGKIA